MEKNINTNCRLNWSFWLSIFAIVISLTTVILFFWKVNSNSVVNASTFIGAMTAIIGISVTLVVGYQIYSVIDLKQKISDINTLKESLECLQNQLENLKLEQSESFEIIQSKLFSNESLVNVCDAFLHLHFALKYSLSVDHKIEGYSYILSELKKYMLNINTSSFMGCSNKEDYEKSIYQFKELYKNNDIQIREHQNYLYIRDKYEELMSKFEKRLNYISLGKNVSPDEIDKLFD